MKNTDQITGVMLDQHRQEPVRKAVKADESLEPEDWDIKADMEMDK